MDYWSRFPFLLRFSGICNFSVGINILYMVGGYLSFQDSYTYCGSAVSCLDILWRIYFLVSFGVFFGNTVGIFFSEFSLVYKYFRETMVVCWRILSPTSF